MNQMHTFKKSLLTIAVLFSSYTSAAGFQISEHSATGLGRAFAGEGAIADNAAVASRNPAAMVLFDTPELSLGMTVIDPEIDASVTAGKMGPLPLKTGSMNDIAPIEFVPNFHYVHPLNDRVAVGISAFSNFGLSTDFGNEVAGPIAGDTKLITMNLNANLAYRINQQFSVGAGINAIYASAELNRFGPAFSNDQSIPSLGPNNTISHMKGDGYGLGWNIGSLWEINDNNRLALTYRSTADITLNGDYKGTATSKPKVDGELELNLPDIAELSGYHKISPKWAIHYSAMYIGWNSFKELKGTSPDCGTDNVCLEKPENWENSWRYAIGATHTLNDKWTLRAGFAYDESPVPDDHKTLSIPDSDRQWYTLGATYHLQPNMSLDAGFAYLKGKTSQATETEDPFTYTFNAGGDAYLYSVQFNYLF